MGDCDDNRRVHYFLDGYPQLTFQAENGAYVSPREFISSGQENGVMTYEVIDTTLMLVYRKDGEPYSGYIRTYHWDIYNLEGVFREGKIERLRYWHPNRHLGMDADYKTNSGKIWDSSGGLSITWSDGESQYWNTLTGRIRQISNDTLTSYYNYGGVLTRYSIRSDTAVTHYYGDGTPRMTLPFRRDGIFNGEVRRWYPNGQLQVVGQYRYGEEYGTWIQYDSTGKDVSREVFD